MTTPTPDATNPTPTSEQLPNLGPGQEQPEGESSPFLMASADWYTLQRYVNSTFILPTNDDAMRRSVGMLAFESVEPLRNLIDVFSRMQTHCRTWKDVTFPRSVELSSRLVQYNLMVPDAYEALIDALKAFAKDRDPDRRAECLEIIDALQGDANQNADEAAAVRDMIVAFSNQSAQDKRDLSNADQQLEALYGANGTQLQEYRQKLKDQQEALEEANRQYEHDVTVAATTPTYAWIIPFGLIAGAVVAGVYGDRAVKAKEAADAAEAEIGRLEHDIAVATRMMQISSTGDTLADNIMEKLDPALKIIQKIEGIWRALASDLGNVTKLLDEVEKGTMSEERLLKVQLKVRAGIRQWDAVAQAANNYRVNAFVDVPEPPVPAAIPVPAA